MFPIKISFGRSLADVDITLNVWITAAFVAAKLTFARETPWPVTFAPLWGVFAAFLVVYAARVVKELIRPTEARP